MAAYITKLRFPVLIKNGGVNTINGCLGCIIADQCIVHNARWEKSALQPMV